MSNKSVIVYVNKYVTLCFFPVPIDGDHDSVLYFAFADLTESPETRHHPFCPGLCVDDNDGLWLDAQTTESGAEAES